jgi:hypothetical protein
MLHYTRLYDNVYLIVTRSTLGGNSASYQLSAVSLQQFHLLPVLKADG